MWRFSSDNQMWTEMHAYVQALMSCTCFTTGERLQLEKIHAKFASSAAMIMSSANSQVGWTGSDALYVISATQKLFSRKQGAND